MSWLSEISSYSTLFSSSYHVPFFLLLANNVIFSTYVIFYYHMTVGTGEDYNTFFHSLYYIRTSYVEGSYFYQIILVVDIGSSNINVPLIWIFGNQVLSCLIFAKNEEKFWHSWLSLAWWEIGIDKLAVFLFEDILQYWLLKI